MFFFVFLTLIGGFPNGFRMFKHQQEGTPVFSQDGRGLEPPWNVLLCELFGRNVAKHEATAHTGFVFLGSFVDYYYISRGVYVAEFCFLFYCKHKYLCTCMFRLGKHYTCGGAYRIVVM